MRVFSDVRHAAPEHRQRYLNPILKYFWGDGTKFELEYKQRNSFFGDCFQLVDSPSDADLCLLPMTWNYYTDFSQQSMANELADLCGANQRSLVIFVHGDRGIKQPFANALVVQYADFRHLRRHYIRIQPGSITDVLEASNSGLDIREKNPIPVVGFCGQATSNRLWALYIRNALTYLEYAARLSSFEPISPITPHLVLRATALNRLRETPGLTPNFIVRSNSYTRKSAPSTRKVEFLNNLLGSDYTVCIRGTSNYSLRFYEALSAGRIPIFVDTDCVLPFENVINWKDYCVWVPAKEIGHIGEIVLQFHNSISSQGFRELQHECRLLWERMLSPEGFYSNTRLWIEAPLHLQVSGMRA